jgi:acetyl-CoA synthetase
MHVLCLCIEATVSETGRGSTPDSIGSSGSRQVSSGFESGGQQQPSFQPPASSSQQPPQQQLPTSQGYQPSEQLADELKKHVKRITAPYKYPRIVEFVDELPKTISGKIRRVEIRENDKEKL